MVVSCITDGHCTDERPLFFGARPWCEVPAVASQNQPASAWHARARHFAHCLSGGGAARELTTRAPRAALVAVGLRTRQGHCTRERSFSVGARPWFDVPPAASDNQPAFACSRGMRERATAPAVSREEPMHASLLRARVVPRSLWSVHALDKAIGPARGLSPSARGRGATCQLRPPTPIRLSRVNQAHAHQRLPFFGRRRSSRA